MNPFFQQIVRMFENMFGQKDQEAERRKPRRPPSPPRLDDMVVHECGHASIAWMSPAVAYVDGIEFHHRGGTTLAGFIKSRTDCRQELLVYALGGLAGELLLCGKVHTRGMGGSKGDLPQALEHAEAILVESTPERVARGWNGGLADASLDIAKMFRRRPPRDVAAVLNLGYRRAKHLLTVNRPGFERLCRLAAGRRSLSRSDIESQFGPRLWAPGGH